jgi:hypothetical protein
VVGVMTQELMLIVAAGVIVPLLGLALRTWMLKEIDRRVQFRFDKEIEVVKSDLRLKESKISALHTLVFSRLAGKQAAIDKRRIEALEALWNATLQLGVFLMSASLVTFLKLEEIDKRQGPDDGIQKLLQPFIATDIKEKLDGISAEAHRPFIPENVWKIFSAYQGLLIICQMRLQALSTGMKDTGKLFATSKMIDQIKDVMPHLSEYLDKHGLSGAAQLADPLRDLLLKAIRTALDESENEENAALKVFQLIEEFEKQHSITID